MNPIQRERIRLGAIEREAKRRLARALSQKALATRTSSGQNSPAESGTSPASEPADQTTGQTASRPLTTAQIIEKLRTHLRAGCSVKECLAALRLTQEELDAALAASSIDLTELIKSERLAGRAALKLARQREVEKGNARFLDLTEDDEAKLTAEDWDAVKRARKLRGMTREQLAAMRAELLAVVSETPAERLQRLVALSPTTRILSAEQAAEPPVTSQKPMVDHPISPLPVRAGMAGPLDREDEVEIIFDIER